MIRARRRSSISCVPTWRRCAKARREWAPRRPVTRQKIKKKVRNEKERADVEWHARLSDATRMLRGEAAPAESEVERALRSERDAALEQARLLVDLK